MSESLNKIEMSAMKTGDVISALRQAANIYEAEHDVIEEVHQYAHAHGCTAGHNVFRFLLDDAMRLRMNQFTLHPKE